MIFFKKKLAYFLSISGRDKKDEKRQRRRRSREKKSKTKERQQQQQQQQQVVEAIVEPRREEEEKEDNSNNSSSDRQDYFAEVIIDELKGENAELRAAVDTRDKQLKGAADKVNEKRPHAIVFHV